VAEAVDFEPISAVETPNTGKFQAKGTLFGRLTLIIHVESTSYARISAKWNRDFFPRNRDFQPRNRDFDALFALNSAT